MITLATNDGIEEFAPSTKARFLDGHEVREVGSLGTAAIGERVAIEVEGSMVIGFVLHRTLEEA